MSDTTAPRPTRFRTGGISPRKPTRFIYRPDAPERARLATELGLLALHGLDFTGEITPKGRDELALSGKITARVDQACVVTLSPVRSEVSDTVRRRYLVGFEDPTGEEAEIPDDDAVEAMPELIDLVQIATEALTLALPLYPRLNGAELGETEYSPDNADPLTDSVPKPFAGLADLANRLSDKDNSGTGGNS